MDQVNPNRSASGRINTQTTYESDLWSKGLDKTFSDGRRYARVVGERWTRRYALDIVKTVHALRNRVAHHEPLVNGIPLPGGNRRITLTDRGTGVLRPGDDPGPRLVCVADRQQ